MSEIISKLSVAINDEEDAHIDCLADIHDDNPTEATVQYESDDEPDICVVKSRRRAVLTDSDSDNENLNHNRETVSDENNDDSTETNEPMEKMSNHDSDNNSDSRNSPTIIVRKSGSRILALCDSESSADESSCDENDVNKALTDNANTEVNYNDPVPLIQPKSSNKSNSRSIKKLERDLTEERRAIHSETQRMIRESRLSLPYHQPKIYSYREFFEKRSELLPLRTNMKKLITAPPAVAINLTDEKLLKFEERAKQAKEFYKLKSEHECITEDMKDLIGSLIDAAVDAVLRCLDVDGCDTNEQTVENREDLVFIDEPLDIQKDRQSLSSNTENFQPRLNCTDTGFIVLDATDSLPNPVTEMVHRYAKHIAVDRKVKADPQSKHTVSVDIARLNTGTNEIQNETLSMLVEDTRDDKRAVIETPGAKHKQLKAELHVQLLQKRSELWKQRIDNEMNDEEIQEQPDELDKLLDDEEEEEMSVTDEEEYDEEEELIIKKSKKRRKKKYAQMQEYVDDEAEVSDMDYDNDDDEEDVENEEEDGQDEELDGDNDGKFEDVGSAKVAAESDEEHTQVQDTDDELLTEKRSLKRIIQPLDDEDSDDDNATQQSTNDPQCAPSHVVDNDLNLEFITPADPLTTLKSDLDNEIPRSDNAPVIQSVIRIVNGMVTTDVYNDPVTDEQDDLLKDKSLLPVEEELVPSTQDLLDICSGAFPEPDNNEQNDAHPVTCDDDLIKDSLLENQQLGFDVKPNPSILDVFSDDDEDMGIGIKRRGKVTVLRDDDDDESNEAKSSQLSHLDHVSEHEEMHREVPDDDDDAEDHNSYDDQSDEHYQNDSDNDLEDDQNESVPQRAINIEDFVENEAQLSSDSEYEGGSEDEDERGLDVLEEELGDKEKLDENVVRQDLERIHLRRMLDDDTHEVKLLQELLLEDGELHGRGRQRQFRWKYMDSDEEADGINLTREEGFLDEEVDSVEEQRRKMRFERELFFEKHSRSQRTGLKVNIQSSSRVVIVNNEESVKTEPAIHELSSKCVDARIEDPFSLMHKRGSFLNRSDEVLQRLMEYNKSSDSGGSVKVNGRSFLFKHLSSMSVDETCSEDESVGAKRKAETGTPKTIKKLRLSTLL